MVVNKKNDGYPSQLTRLDRWMTAVEMSFLRLQAGSFFSLKSKVEQEKSVLRASAITVSTNSDPEKMLS